MHSGIGCHILAKKKQYNIAAYLLRQNFAYGALKHYLGKIHTRFWDRPCAPVCMCERGSVCPHSSVCGCACVGAKLHYFVLLKSTIIWPLIHNT